MILSLAVFQYNHLYTFHDVLAGVAAGFHPVEQLCPCDALQRLRVFAIESAHRRAIEPVTLLFEIVDFDNRLRETLERRKRARQPAPGEDDTLEPLPARMGDVDEEVL